MSSNHWHASESSAHFESVAPNRAQTAMPPDSLAPNAPPPPNPTGALNLPSEDADAFIKEFNATYESIGLKIVPAESERKTTEDAETNEEKPEGLRGEPSS